MAKVFGKASDFYRARILTLEEEVPPDFDWRDDVLYRTPKEHCSRIKIDYCLQIIDLDSRKSQVLKQYSNRTEAEQTLKIIEEQLDDLTKMEFEKKYDLHLTEESPLNEDIEEISANETNAERDNKKNVPRNLS